ncbi:MAG: hypothetical protein J6C23_03930 [Clostridia bacterium]|nr:hypothetical protein [Clostridia bacterium]
MENIEPVEHFNATSTELDKVNWVCDSKDILRDIKFYIREYYIGFYNEDSESLTIKFNNGQKFRVVVTEMN